MPQRAPSILISLSLLLALCGILMGKAYFWEITAFVITPARRVYFITAALLFIAAVITGRYQIKNFTLYPGIFLWGLLIFFITDQLYNDYGLIRAPSARGSIIFGGLIFSYWIIKDKIISWRLPAILTILMAIGLIIIETEGHRITSDDHQTFLHRIMLLKDNFPNIPFYDPLWNAGTDQRNFFATGALAIFFAAQPWLSILEPVTAYNYIMLTVAFVFFPLSLYAASRIMGLSKNAAWLSIILGLTAAFDWYRWLLSYGTMGFICAISILPLNLALVFKFLSSPAKASWPFVLLLSASFSYMLLWTPAGMIFAPFILIGLIKVFFSGKADKRKILLTALLLAVINLPWISVFWSVSKVTTFLNANVAATKHVQSVEEEDGSGKDNKVKYFRHKKDAVTLMSVFDFAREHLASYNPIIYFLLLPGILLLRTDFRWYFIMAGGWLAALGLIAVKLVPQLELDRMLIALAIIGAIPAAAAATKFFESTASAENSAFKLFNRFVALSLAGYIFASSMALAEIAQRRTTNDYKFAGANSEDILPVLTNYGKLGRIVFSGCITHEMDGGHLAPFTDLTGAALVASSQAHDIWWYKQVFPEEYLARKDAGIEEYLDLMNAVVVTAHEKKWRDYFAKRPDKYQLTHTVGAFQFYRRLNFKNNYFLTGQGEILEQKNSILRIRIDESPAIIKFKHYDFLESTACDIKPEIISESVHFIRIENCPAGTELNIKAKAAWKRLHF